MRKSKWEKLDSDLWRLRGSVDEAIVIYRSGMWLASIERRLKNKTITFEETFEATTAGLAKAKARVEAVWEMVQCAG